MIRSGHGAIRAFVLVAQLALLVACAGAPTATPAGTPAATLELSAHNVAYDRSTLTAPADAPFAIEFDNRDPALHNVNIRRAGTTVFQGEIFIGPSVRTYLVSPLSAGQYDFFCAVHPDMVGTLIVH